MPLSSALVHHHHHHHQTRSVDDAQGPWQARRYHRSQPVQQRSLLMPAGPVGPALVQVSPPMAWRASGRTRTPSWTRRGARKRMLELSALSGTSWAHPARLRCLGACCAMISTQEAGRSHRCVRSEERRERHLLLLRHVARANKTARRCGVPHTHVLTSLCTAARLRALRWAHALSFLSCPLLHPSSFSSLCLALHPQSQPRTTPTTGPSLCVSQSIAPMSPVLANNCARWAHPRSGSTTVTSPTLYLYIEV